MQTLVLENKSRSTFTRPLKPRLLDSRLKSRGGYIPPIRGRMADPHGIPKATGQRAVIISLQPHCMFPVKRRRPFPRPLFVDAPRRPCAATPGAASMITRDADEAAAHGPNQLAHCEQAKLQETRRDHDDSVTTTTTRRGARN